MAPEFTLIANPVSGWRKGPQRAAEVLARLKKAGRHAEMKLTTAQGDAGRLAADAAAHGSRVIVAAGGDGTLHEVACALAGAPATMGILPFGRCNDLARALGIFKHTPVDALARMLLEGPVRAIDLGRYEPRDNPEAARRFCTVATLGLDSDVTRYVDEHKLRLKGTLSYLYATARVLLKFKPPHVRLRWDNGDFDGRILLAATGNTPYYGGAMHICPGATPDDGLLNVCLIEAVGRMTILRIIPRVYSGRHVQHKKVRMLTTKRLEIETPDGAQVLYADGERLGTTPGVISVEAGRLKVILGAFKKE